MQRRDGGGAVWGWDGAGTGMSLHGRAGTVVDALATVTARAAATLTAAADGTPASLAVRPATP
ncbi:hypothetical protein GCM10009827_107900 [Dactylosporangium maewongense]|uniref:Uncharacterized protein n=1 Tax=Dactylosporangium maewongense TaxID=634393 RepID=A0ABN2D1H3_9ACTN